MRIKNKKGWIRIIEASVAILLIAGVLLIVIERESSLGGASEEIYNSQLIVLRDIQGNDTLRQSVLDITPPLESSESGFPQNIKDTVEYLSLDSLICEEKICFIESTCTLNEPPEKNVYAQSVMITVIKTQVEKMNPRQLKIFCWRK